MGYPFNNNRNYTGKWDFPFDQPGAVILEAQTTGKYLASTVKAFLLLTSQMVNDEGDSDPMSKPGALSHGWHRRVDVSAQFKRRDVFRKLVASLIEIHPSLNFYTALRESLNTEARQFGKRTNN